MTAELAWFTIPSPIIWWQLALYLASVAWGSFIIGCFGVGGGAIFVPLLLMLPGVEPRIAVGTVLVAAIPMSWARSTQLYYYGRLDIRGASVMMMGATVGALLGQFLLPYCPSDAIAFLVAALAIFAGVKAQLKLTRDYWSARDKALASHRATPYIVDPSVVAAQQECPRQTAQKEGAASINCYSLECAVNVVPSDVAAENGVKDLHDVAAVNNIVADGPKHNAGGDAEQVEAVGVPNRRVRQDAAVKVGIGFVVAFLSSLSGTGGPMIFFPLMFMWQPSIPMKKLIGISCPLSCCLVTVSAVGALLFGKVDVGFALVFGAISVVFTLLGGAAMERLGDSIMKLVIGVFLIGIGTAVGIKTAIGLIA